MSTVVDELKRRIRLALAFQAVALPAAIVLTFRDHSPAGGVILSMVAASVGLLAGALWRAKAT
jgi:hypothetical protein